MGGVATAVPVPVLGFVHSLQSAVLYKAVVFDGYTEEYTSHETHIASHIQCLELDG